MGLFCCFFSKSCQKAENGKRQIKQIFNPVFPKAKKKFFRFFVSVALIATVGFSVFTLFVFVRSVLAAVTVTAATGGTSISADKAANAASPAWTTLGNIVITEGANTDFAASQTNNTLILTAPSNWSFNAGVGAVTHTGTSPGSADITANSIAVTATTVTITFSTDGTANKSDVMTISGLQVRANDGSILPSSGDILRTVANPGTGTIAGIVNGTTSFGALSQSVGAKNKLAITTQPSSTAVTNTDFSVKPVVKVEDQFGNVVTTDSTSTISRAAVLSTQACGGTAGSGAITSTPGNGAAVTAGVMTYTAMQYSVAESIKICFTSAGITSTLSNAITVVAPPQVTNVTSSTANGSYKAADVISIQVVFNQSVTVTGTPQLTLSTGSPATTVVNYTSGSPGATLTFNYTVSAGNTSADLDYNSTGALALNGGTIKDTATGLANANLTLASPGAAGSLGANKNIIIDTTPPGAFSITGPATPTNDNTPDVTWGSASGATKYDIKVDDTSGCGSPVQTYLNEVGISKTLTSLGDGTYYVCVTAKDDAGNTTNATNNNYSFVVDTIPPGAFSITGPATPTNDNTPNATWGASSGATKYDLKVDDTSGCGSPVQTYNNLVGTSQTLTILGDGTYYVCVTAKDDATNATNATNNNYSFVVDTTNPTDPTSVASSDHTISVPSSDNTITMTWTAATDALSGVDGYAYVFNTTSSPTCDQTKDLEETATTVTSSVLSDGINYYFHVCTVDNAGNWTSTVSVGPYIIDTTDPDVTVNQAGGQADPTNALPVSFTVVFSETINPATFTTADITQNGTATGITWSLGTSDNITWSLQATAITTDGTVRPSIGATKVQDPAGNPNTASTSADNTVTYDTTDPTDPTGVASSDHTVSVPSNDNTITMTWTAATDALSGVDGYAYVFNTSAASVCDQTKDLEETATTVTSSVLSDGTGYYFHICTVDNAGNWTGTVNVGPFIIDTLSPDVTVDQAGGQADPTNALPVSFAVVFSEAINPATFTSGDITQNGTATITTWTVTNSGDNINFTVRATAISVDGTVQPSIGATKVKDPAGNDNTASTSVDNTVTYDSIPPGAFSITGPATLINNATPTVAWGAASGATKYDLKVDDTSGCGSPVQTYNNLVVTSQILTALGDGTYYVCVTAKDDAGNTTNASNDNYSFTVDTIPPTVTINQDVLQVDPTNISPINFTVVFSESTTDFITGDVFLSGTAGATTDTVTGGGTTYNVAVFGMTTDGTVVATINAGEAHDAAGNSNTASTSTDNTVTYDTTGPTVVSSVRVGSSPTNATSVDFTVTFDDDVLGVDTADFSLTVGGGISGESVTGVASVSGSIYTVTINTGAGDGSIRLDVPATATITDALGNAITGLPYTSGETYAIDKTSPDVTLSSTAPDPTNTSPIPMTATFTENMTGFDVLDISVGNGIAGNFAGGPTIFTFDVTPAGQGAVTVDIASAVAVDAAGNGNTAATQFSITYDTVSPDVTLSSTAPDPTNTSPIPMTATFTENMTGFDVLDISVGNGIAGNFAGGPTIFTFDVTPAGQGAVTVDIAAAVAKDLAGNDNTAATQFGINFDSDKPTVIMSSAAGDPTKTSPISVTATFSEDVTGFDATDVAVSNCVLSNFTGGPAIYTFDLAPSSEGTITVDIAADAAQDGAGNGNFIAVQFTRVYDITSPDVTLSSTAPDPTNTSPIPMTATFTENMTGFDVLDISVGNGIAGNFAGGPTIFTFDVTPAGQGAVTVDIAAAVAKDLAGNDNTAATQFGIFYDSVLPGAPTLLSPADTNFINDPTPAFDWSDAADPAPSSGVIYDLLVDDDPLFLSPEINETGLVSSDFTPTVALVDGVYNWKVKSRDNAGNDPWSSVFTFTLDTNPPDTTITSAIDGAAQPVLNNGTTASRDITFTFTATEAGTFECQLDGGIWAACASPKNFTTLSPGSHLFRVRGLDQAGNSDLTPDSLAWKISGGSNRAPVIMFNGQGTNIITIRKISQLKELSVDGQLLSYEQRQEIKRMLRPGLNSIEIFIGGRSVTLNIDYTPRKLNLLKFGAKAK